MSSNFRHKGKLYPTSIQFGLSLFIVLFVFISINSPIYAQRIDTEFGKNRVQYHDDFKYWWNYESENFILHYYGKGENVAKTAIMMAEYDHTELFNTLEYSLPDKIEIIVYLDVNDLKQSNLGVSEDLFTDKGESFIIGNKLFVYYNGDHQKMRKRIRKGIALVYFNSILFGSSLQDIVQNAISTDLPEWFKEGLLEYLAEPWSFEDEAKLKEIFHNNPKLKNFKKLSQKHPKIAGHSFWYFISKQYGQADIPNIIYLTRIKRRINEGFVFVLNKEINILYSEWLSFYESQMDIYVETSELAVINLKKKKDELITRVKLSPDEESYAYATNSLGRMNVYYSSNGDKPKRLWNKGQKVPMIEWNANYPIIDFNKNGQQLLVIYDHHDVIYFRAINLKDGTVREGSFPEDIQNVYAADFYHNSRFLLSVQIDGYAELVSFFPDTRNIEKVTADYYEDLNPHMGELNGTKGIFFNSNRRGYMKYGEQIEKDIPLNHHDIYFLSLNRKELYQITNTPYINETHPVTNGDKILYSSDESGLKEVRYLELAKIDFKLNERHAHRTIKAYKNTVLSNSQELSYSNYEGAVVDFDIQGGQLINIVDQLESSLIYINISGNSYPLKKNSKYREDYNHWVFSEFEDNLEHVTEEDTAGANIDDTTKEELKKSYFKTRYKDFKGSMLPHKNTLPNKPAAQKSKVEINRTIHDYKPIRAIAYKLRFGIQELSTNASNDLLFKGLNTFAGMNEEFEPPPLGLLLKGTIKDVYEDHIIEGGARYQFNFDGAEYFLSYKDLSKQIDKTYAAYTKGHIYRSFNANGRQDQTKERNIIFLNQWKYPFDFFSSIRATGTLRFDKTTFLSTDATSLASRDSVAERIGLRLEYVFDNTYVPDINQIKGARAKVYVEFVNRFEIGLNSDSDFSLSEGFMTLIGVDGRYYKTILGHSTLAFRVAAATSLGNEKILFHVGGVENWIFNSFDNTIPIPSGENYVYRTIATNLRGFQYNARNGNSFGIFNAELRVPIFKHIFSDRLRSSFLRGFQVVGFFDAGSAWTGLNPFDDNNPLNNVTVSVGDLIVVNARFSKNPFIYGYGAGIRALALGYTVKIDYAWGVENGRSLEPRLYLSLGADF